MTWGWLTSFAENCGNQECAMSHADFIALVLLGFLYVGLWRHRTKPGQNVHKNRFNAMVAGRLRRRETE